MTEKEYYSEKRVSSSSIKWFESGPLFFRKMLDKEIEQETKRYFEIGKKIHMRILEQDEFNKNYIYLDYTTPKSEQQRKFCEDYISYRSKSKNEKLLYAYKSNYSADKLTEEKILEKAEELKGQLSKYITYLKKRSEVKDILSFTDMRLIQDLAEETEKHIAANKLLYLTDEDRMNGLEEYNEQVIFFEYMGVECKSMIDRFIVNHKDKTIKLIDLKTTSNLGDFGHSFEEFKYYRQMAFYWIALYSYFKEQGINLSDYSKETYIVGLQKGDVPECRVFEITEDWLTLGHSEISEVLYELKWHFDNDLWEHRQEYYENNGIEKI
jgi:hypothetical protein